MMFWRPQPPPVKVPCDRKEVDGIGCSGQMFDENNPSDREIVHLEELNPLKGYAFMDGKRVPCSQLKCPIYEGDRAECAKCGEVRHIKTCPYCEDCWEEEKHDP